MVMFDSYCKYITKLLLISFYSHQHSCKISPNDTWISSLELRVYEIPFAWNSVRMKFRIFTKNSFPHEIPTASKKSTLKNKSAWNSDRMKLQIPIQLCNTIQKLWIHFKIIHRINMQQVFLEAIKNVNYLE